MADRGNWLADTDELQEVRADKNALVLESPVEQDRASSQRKSPRKPEGVTAAAAPPPPPPPMEPSDATIHDIVERLLLSGEWCKAFDAGSGKTYFYNPSTRATTWNLRALVEREFVAYKGSVEGVPPPPPAAAASPDDTRDPSPARAKLNKARAASKQKQQRQQSPQQREWRSRVVELYRRHNPSKLMVVDELLLRYEGREAELWRNLCSKYSASSEPSPSPQAKPHRHDDPTRELFSESELLHVTSPRLRGLSPCGDTAAVGTHHSHPRYREDSQQPEPHPAPAKQATPKGKSPRSATTTSSCTPRTATPKRVAFGRAMSPAAAKPAAKRATPTAPLPAKASSKQSVAKKKPSPAKVAAADDPDVEPPTPDASAILTEEGAREALRGARPATPSPYSPQQVRTAAAITAAAASSQQQSPSCGAVPEDGLVEDQALQPPLPDETGAEDHTPQFVDTSKADDSAGPASRSLSPRALAELKARQILQRTSRQRPAACSSPRTTAAPLPRVARLSAARSQTASQQQTADHCAWQDELLRREREAAARREYLVEERQRAAQRRNTDLQRRMQDLQRIRDEERELRRQHQQTREEAARLRQQQEQLQRAASPGSTVAVQRPSSSRGQILEERHRAALRSNSAPCRNAPGSGPQSARTDGDFDATSPMFMNGWKVGRAIAENADAPLPRPSKKLSRNEVERSSERLQRHYSSPASRALASAAMQGH